MSDQPLVRVAILERRLRSALILNSVLVLLMVSFVIANCRTARGIASEPGVLTVSELDVVDPHGVVRARLGGDLPDAVINGKRVARGQKAAGVLLYDDTGQERGGYITFAPGRQVALTLDNRTSAGQTAMLIAGPEGGSALQLSYGGDLVELRVDDETGPSIHAVRAKQVAFHVPLVLNFDKTQGCAEFRDALKKYSREQILEWCRARVSEEACQACIGSK